MTRLHPQGRDARLLNDETEGRSGRNCRGLARNALPAWSRTLSIPQQFSDGEANDRKLVQRAANLTISLYWAPREWDFTAHAQRVCSLSASLRRGTNVPLKVRNGVRESSAWSSCSTRPSRRRSRSCACLRPPLIAFFFFLLKCSFFA